MNIDNIEKCKMLLDKRAALQLASDLLEAKSARVVIVTGYGEQSEKTDLFDEDLNRAVIDAIDTRIKAVEKQISTL